MGKRGPQPTGKTTGVIRLKKVTIDAIRHLSHETGKSQSEVVDRAIEAMDIIKYCWLALQATLPYTEDGGPEDLFIINRSMDKIATWKEKS